MAPTISRELFVMLLERTEKPDDPRARALLSSLDCAVSGLLLRLVKADETESLELQRKIDDVLASERGHRVQ